MKTKAEIEKILWNLVGQKKPEVVSYWYRKLMKLRDEHG